MNLKTLRNHKSQRKKKKEAPTFENAKRILEGRQKSLNNFESKISPKKNGHKEKDVQPVMLARIHKVSDHSHLKILSPKQMLQRLSMALTD